MKNKYLEITYRKGKVMAAYLYLPREVGEKSLRTEKFIEGILIDYGKFNQPIGIEITDPRKIRANIINEILYRIENISVQAEEFAPMLASSYG